MPGSEGTPLTRRQLRERERAGQHQSIELLDGLDAFRSYDDQPASPAEQPAFAAEREPEPESEPEYQPETRVVVDSVAPDAPAPATLETPVASVVAHEPVVLAPGVSLAEAPERASREMPVRSRRDARTDQRASESTRSGRRASAAKASSAVQAPAAAQAPVAAIAAAPRRSLGRRAATKGMATLAIGFVALMAVATSTPAAALLTPADVQAAATAAHATGGDGNGDSAQSVRVSDAVSNDAVQRDGYGAESIAQVAAESGIRLEASYTNDPNGTVQWPFKVGVHIGDRFGYRNCAGCSEDHHGQDFNPGLGAPIQAIADGVVSYVQDGEGSLGVHMMITHQINGQTVTSVYAHMQHGSMKFKLGDTVKVGDVIGNVGNTGMSTGPHLHFEIRLGGITGPWTDPLVWLYANTN